MQGLQVLRFESSKVMAHPKVVEWERRMREAASKKSSGQEEDGFF